ncbi:nicotinamide N-methyltransferase-like [Pseudophryne corroboree]|uniref:nicotinamide N-methyltransferase-like n=1 Tax=Pseudophryne corroboree TaxID=495146 RepID=UPI003081A239
MDPSSVKFYHTHEFDAKTILEKYFSTTTDEKIFREIVLFPLRSLQKLQASGNIKGGILIDFSTGPSLSHLFPICEDFHDITLLETNDFCIKELESWINKEEEAFDWCHLAEFHPELEGYSEKWMEKEESLRRNIKHIVKCDLDKENPADPFVLEKADCLITVYILHHISEDKDSYRKNLIKLSSMIKVGGHLIIVGGFNATFFSIGQHKYHALNIDEDYVRKVIADVGFTIEHLQTLESKLCHDDVTYDHLYVLTARKVKEVKLNE